MSNDSNNEDSKELRVKNDLLEKVTQHAITPDITEEDIKQSNYQPRMHTDKVKYILITLKIKQNKLFLQNTLRLDTYEPQTTTTYIEYFK